MRGRVWAPLAAAAAAGAILMVTGGWMLLAPSVAPVSITLSLANPTIPDNAPAGTLVATASVVMSDGSAYKGTVTSSNPLFVGSGVNILTARALVPTDDGTKMSVIAP